MSVPGIETIVAVTLALGVLAPLLQTSVPWRRRLPRLAINALLAVLLDLAVFPPSLAVRDDRLTVLTAGRVPVTERLWRMLGLRDPLTRVVALPEADAVPGAVPGAVHMPDLASALRSAPSIARLHVVGAGLRPRDQAAAAAVAALRFEPAAAQGLVELSAPASVAQGTQWALRGRALAPVVRVELQDPSGAVVDRANVDRDGAFRLSASARAAGQALYRLRTFDAAGVLNESAGVPLRVIPGETLHVLLRAGAPDPEFKYWRRWARDAGLDVQATAMLSEAVEAADRPVAFTPAALAAADLVIIDERAWRALEPAEKAALGAAVRAGLGLLLRIAGPPEPDVLQDWATLGVSLAATDTARAVTIDRATGLSTRAAFTAAAVTIAPGDSASLLTDDSGERIATVRDEGRGRVAVWALVDSYRLQLLGESGRYGGLWQRALAAVSRAQPAVPEPSLPAFAWVDERSVICGLVPGSTVVAPDASTAALAVDAEGCAGYWPAQSGWHAVQRGGTRTAFYVRAIDDAPGLREQRNRLATQALVADDLEAQAVPAALRRVPVPRAPLWLLWLIVATGIWWRERMPSSRAGA